MHSIDQIFSFINEMVLQKVVSGLRNSNAKRKQPLVF